VKFLLDLLGLFLPGIALDSEPDTVIHTAFLKFQRFGLLFLLERGSTPLGKKSSKPTQNRNTVSTKKSVRRKESSSQGWGRCGNSLELLETCIVCVLSKPSPVRRVHIR